MRYLLLLTLLLLPSTLLAAAPELDPWLYQHPDVSGTIVWDFPDELPELPADNSVRTSLPPWLQKGRAGAGTSSGNCGGNSCPQYVDFSPAPGKTMQWYYWPEPYKARLRSYFQQYYTWMEGSWPLYQQYQESDYSQKPPGFEARFASHEDPATGALPALLPVSASVMKDKYTHVLFEPGPAFDLYLKTVAMQLVLELGSFVDWKLSDYRSEDLAVVLDGRYLFRYFPAGSAPWGGTQTVDKEGYDTNATYPAPPLVAMKFLMNEGILRDSRWETLTRWLEWERSNLQHTMGDPQSLTGECGKEYHEVYWGSKGPHPASAHLHGTVMACALVPIPGSGSTQSPFFSPEVKHYTGGCGNTGSLNHRMLRQINVPAEPVAFTHGQTRFVVEQNSLQQMLSNLGPQLPAEPAIDDGVIVLAGGVPLASTALNGSSQTPSHGIRLPSSALVTTFGPGAGLANAYIDHNDNPYGMAQVPEALVAEALLSETTYRRWFPEVPSYLDEEERSQFYSAHNKRVSLRPIQLRIARLPLHLLQYYCWKEDAGKPHGETETYKQYFEGTYTAEELEATGFWVRFEQKLADSGGCEGLPPMY